MKIRSLSPSVLGSVGACVAALVLSPAMSPRAYAFGGLWSSETAPVHQAAEEIVFVDNPDATVTAIVAIKYAGPAQKFAWVIPVPGRPTVGVSSSTVFRRLDAATAPEYWVEVTVEGTCKPPAPPDAGADSGSDVAPGGLDAAPAPIKIDEGSVGPYDYVNIAVDPSLGDPVRLATDWLTKSGYGRSSLDATVLGPYLKDGLHLLAFKLAAGADVGEIRPVVLTYESKVPTIPIRPTAVAARDGMGIQVWVFGPSQAVPENYKSLVLDDARLDWLTGPKYVAGTLPAGGVGPFGGAVSKPSNYDAVVSAAGREAGGQGFVTELGGPASQYRDKVWSPLDDQEFTMISKRRYGDGIDAILAANRRFGGWDGWREAIQGATALPAGVTLDEFGRHPDQYRGVARVDATKFFQLLRKKVLDPVAAAAAMLYRAPYLTRLYSTMSADEMTLDPSFNYNFDLAQVSNVHIARQSLQCSPTLNPYDAPWRIRLPQGGVIEGRGSGWPVAEGSMPANLKIVTLSTRGSGAVVKDNSEDIGAKLFDPAKGDGGPETPRPPQNGMIIGGAQAVTPHGAGGAAPAPAPSSRQPPGGDRCSVSRVGAGPCAPFAPSLALAAAIFVLRRRGPRRPEARARGSLRFGGESPRGEGGMEP
jgi:Uncharacterized protein conserved in bacteria (DUF2330)